MPKEPLFPHRPKKKEPLFPHVPKGRQSLPQTTSHSSRLEQLEAEAAELKRKIRAKYPAGFRWTPGPVHMPEPWPEELKQWQGRLWQLGYEIDRERERLRKGPQSLPQTKGREPTRHDVEVDSWVERDRIGIWIVDLRTDKTIAEWWDEDAREMFDQGFFKPAAWIKNQTLWGAEFKESVLGYAESVGLLAGQERLPATTEKLPFAIKEPLLLPAVAEGTYAWLIIDPETGEIMIKPGYATVDKARRSVRDFAVRRARYAGEHPVEVRIYDREPDIDDLASGVIFKGELRLPEGTIVEEPTSRVLEQLTKDVCYDFRAVRSVVMKHSWELMEKERQPFRAAIKKSWDEVKRQCLKLGAVV